jgi:hypothetical protein
MRGVLEHANNSTSTFFSEPYRECSILRATGRVRRQERPGGTYGAGRCMTNADGRVNLPDSWMCSNRGTSSGSKVARLSYGRKANDNAA